MKSSIVVFLSVFLCLRSFGQHVETIYLSPADTTKNMYVAVVPEGAALNGLLVLMDGFGVAPRDVLVQTRLPMVAAKQGLVTIIPILSTGKLYFGVDSASQLSLKEIIAGVSRKYGLDKKPLYLGGFSIGGSCVVKYAERAVKENDAIKPAAIFAVDPPLDWMRFYGSARRVVRLSEPGKVNGEVTYMIDRIVKEVGGTPDAVPEHYFNLSPYSFADTTQRAVKLLAGMPIMLISEPDIQWWMGQRGYDYTYMNVEDHAAMINELQRLGNKRAVLVTTEGKGFREPAHARHPHSWSIAEPEEVVKWLMERTSGIAQSYYLIGHRGGVVDSTNVENSLPALEEAVRQGYRAVEMDMRLTRDGMLIIQHDRDLKRYYGVNRNVSEMNWAEISKLVSDKGSKVVTLEEEFRHCQGRVQVMLDNKIKGNDTAVWERVIGLLKKYDLLDSAIMIGTDESTPWFTGEGSIELYATATGGE